VYRGALEDVIPQLRLGQNIQARLLDDLNANIYAPVVLDNIENPEEYGPGATLIGTGEGKATVERDRPPVNFEGQRTVKDLIEGARKQATWPLQRSGDPDASILSARGVVALAGSFNAELAWAQQDMEFALTRMNRIAAAFDEQHCAGEKNIDGIDGATGWHERYDPTVLFGGDYRNKVTYGDRSGLDPTQYMTQLAMAKNTEGMSNRTFMIKSGLVDDPLAEETDMAIEGLTNQFLQQVIPQQTEQGNLEPMKMFVEKIDNDNMTVRAAVMETIKEMTAAPAEPPPGAAGPEGQPDIMAMMESLQSGGSPGAEGLPAPPGIGPGLQGALPGPVESLASPQAPPL
jgi:hypothetical protein